MSEDQKSKNTTRGFLCCVIVNFVFIFLISGFAYCERQANQRTHAAKEYSGQVPNTDTNNLYSDYLLQAQQDVALWNYGMFIIALGAFGVTVVGIYFIARTLDATLAAVTQAKKATRAANDAVAVTREIGEAQSRAYISVTSGEAELDRNLPMHLTIRMNIQNTGNSPAANVTIFAEACFEDHLEPDGVYRFKAEKLEVDEVGGKISYPRELNIMEFDIGKLDPLLDNQGNIGIHGRIEYRHVFMSSQDEPIVTTFALSGLIDEKRAKWSKNIVVTPLNTCSHTRWKKNNNTT